MFLVNGNISQSSFQKTKTSFFEEEECEITEGDEGGSAFTGLSNCQTYVKNARNNTEEPEAKYAIQRFYLGKFKDQVKGTDANPCGSAAFYENFKPV